jgi:hypothetical protein
MWEQRRKLQVRLPEPAERKFISLMLQDPFPFFISIFDSVEQFNEIGGASGIFSSSGLAGFASAEQRATLPEDYWLVGFDASFVFSVPGNPGQAFSFQLYHTRGLGEVDEQGFIHQQSPIININMFGTAKQPLYLRVPKFLPKNTELACTVQNLSVNFNQIQVTLIGYLGEPAGGLT